MKKWLPLLIFSTSSLLFVGCEPDEAAPEATAGKGGNATLKVTPKHHSENIDSCMVYLKYNTQDAASTYDDSAKAIVINGKPVATFPGLKKGDYYLFGLGWDPAIISEVRGGIPYTITEEKEIEINIPVSEGHSE